MSWLIHMFVNTSCNDSKEADFHSTNGYFYKHFSLLTHKINVTNVQNNTEEYRNNNLPDEMHEWIGSMSTSNDIVLIFNWIYCQANSICSFHVWNTVWSYINCTLKSTWTKSWELLLDFCESWALSLTRKKNAINWNFSLWTIFHTLSIFKHLSNYLCVRLSTLWHIHWAQ